MFSEESVKKGEISIGLSISLRMKLGDVRWLKTGILHEGAHDLEYHKLSAISFDLT